MKMASGNKPTVETMKKVKCLLDMAMESFKIQREFVAKVVLADCLVDKEGGCGGGKKIGRTPYQSRIDHP